jgi:hypothetical protein
MTGQFSSRGFTAATVAAFIAGIAFGGPIVPGLNDQPNGKAVTPQHANMHLPPLGSSARHWAALGNPEAVDPMADGMAGIESEHIGLDDCAVVDEVSPALWSNLQRIGAAGRGMAVLGFHPPGHTRSPFVNAGPSHGLRGMMMRADNAAQGASGPKLGGSPLPPAPSGGGAASNSANAATPGNNGPSAPAAPAPVEEPKPQTPTPPPLTTPAPALVGDTRIEDLQIDVLGEDKLGSLDGHELGHHMGGSPSPDELVAAVPLPAAVWMGLTGLAALVALRRRLL